jgi:hypothetical protein
MVATIDSRRKNGLSVQLTRFLNGGEDRTDQLQQLFGTARLAPFGMLQATICSKSGNYEIDGTTQIGEPVTATFTGSYTGPTSNPIPLSLSTNGVTVAVPTGPFFGGPTIPVTFAGSDLKISVLPANRTTSWLTAAVQVSTDGSQIVVAASGSGLSNGVYNAKYP